MDFGAFDNMSDAYPRLVGDVIAKGTRVAPDGKPTFEVLNSHFVIEDAVMGGVPIGVGRQIGVKMMAIDGAGVLAGKSYPDVARSQVAIMGEFMNELSTLDDDDVIDRANVRFGELHQQGAYGPRIQAGMQMAEHALRKDPFSRRAVVTLWDVHTDMLSAYRDRPCVTQYQFMIRDGKLDIHTSMRANDLRRGTAYDVWTGGQLQAMLAHVLGVQVGRYYHHATSLHVYIEDLNYFNEMLPVENPRESAGPDWYALESGTYTSVYEVQTRFNNLLFSQRAALNGDPDTFVPANSVEAWYATVFRTGRAPW